MISKSLEYLHIKWCRKSSYEPDEHHSPKIRGPSEHQAFHTMPKSVDGV